MLGTITTVAAIALAHAVVRPPASKDAGWSLYAQPSMLLGARVSTDQPILNVTAYVSTTESTQYTPATKGLDRIELLRAQLESYRLLDTALLGDDGSPAVDSHIDAACSILSLLPAGIPLPRPMLSTDGEVGLYWKSNDYLADAVIEDDSHFSLFIRSLKDGNREVFIPSIAIDQNANDAIASAFQAA